MWRLSMRGRSALRARSEEEHRSLLMAVEKDVSPILGMNEDWCGYGWAASFIWVRVFWSDFILTGR